MQHAYTLSLSVSSAVEIVFLLNIEGSTSKCCTYRFYYRDGNDISYAKIDNDNTASVNVTTQGNGTFNFTLHSWGLIHIKRLFGEYTLT